MAGKAFSCFHVVEMPGVLSVKRLKQFALGSAFAWVPMVAVASGFQLFEQSGSGLGRAFAGMGAASDDASVQ